MTVDASRFYHYEISVVEYRFFFAHSVDFLKNFLQIGEKSSSENQKIQPPTTSLAYISHHESLFWRVVLFVLKVIISRDYWALPRTGVANPVDYIFRKQFLRYRISFCLVLPYKLAHFNHKTILLLLIYSILLVSFDFLGFFWFLSDFRIQYGCEASTTKR